MQFPGDASTHPVQQLPRLGRVCHRQVYLPGSASAAATLCDHAGGVLFLSFQQQQLQQQQL